MAKKKSARADLVTHVVRGITFGDTSNSSVRNILTEISKCIYGRVTNDMMHDTLDSFGGRCPYTGIDLRPLVDGKLGGYAVDHIYPQNKEWCGLNVKGNLIVVDKAANDAKNDQDVETFLLTDTKVLTDIDVLGRTRKERLDAIKAFQDKHNYDPDLVRAVVRPMMEDRYERVRQEQEECIRDVLAKLKDEGIEPVATGIPTTTSAARSSSASSKGYTYAEKIEVVYYYLTHDEGLVQVEENCMKLPGRRGGTVKPILNKLGVDTGRGSTHKGLLLTKSIDDAIAEATDTIFKSTLEEIKRRAFE